MTGFVLKILFSLCLCTGVQSVSQMLSLNCKFSDQQSFVNDDQTMPDVKVVHRDVLLKFGQKEDAPVNPSTVTFLVTGTKLDLRSYLEEANADQLACELHRYSTNGVHVQWPLQETQDYNYWYNCIIKHTRFTVSSFLRQPSQKPAPGRHDYHNWTVIKDGDVLTTTVALIMKTKTPEVKTALGSQSKLDCQFVIDHEGADHTVEWFSLINGQKKTLFRYNSLSESIQGTGVDLKALQRGDASYNLPVSSRVSKGTFICTLSVNPVTASLNIIWTTEVQPKVSLNVNPVLSVENNNFQRVICQVEHYYPVDLKIVWYRYTPTALSQRHGAPLPVVLNKTHSSHRTNYDGTVSLSANLELRPSMKDSGTQYTCKVSHQSLRVPITVSFIINVTDPVKGLFIFYAFFSTIVMLTLLYMFCSMRSARRRRSQRLPY